GSSRTDNIHSRTDSVHSRTDNIHSRTDNIHSRTDNIHSRTDSVHSRTDSVHSRTDNIHSRTDNIHSRTDNIHSRTDSVHSRTDSVHSRTDNIHSRTDNIHSRTDNIHSRTDSVHSRIDNIHSRTDNIHSRTDNIHSRLAVNTEDTTTSSPRSPLTKERLPLYSPGSSIGRTEHLSLHSSSPVSIDRTERLSIHSPGSIDRSERLSIHSPGSIDRSERLSIHSPGSIDRSERLSIHSPGSIDRSERLSIHSPGSIDRSDRFPLHSPDSNLDKVNAKPVSTSFTPFSGSSSRHHYLQSSIPIMPPTASLPATLGLPATWLQYSLYPPPTSLTGNTRPLSLLEYQQQLKQATMPTDLSYFKYKTPLVNRNYLELAMLVCNTFRGKLFPCSHCRYVTDRRNNLKRHISTMHQACDKILECCGVTFATKASLREHITIFHHNGYSCPFCGRRFCRKALLRRHLSVHNGQKDYNCPHCDYATSHKSNLERHKRIHDRLKINEPVPLLAHNRITSSNNTFQSSDDSEIDCTTICDTDDDYPKIHNTGNGFIEQNSPIPLLTNKKISCNDETISEPIYCDVD
ncbi:zinc finger protein SNAI2-like, partial [Argonauta hians]